MSKKLVAVICGILIVLGVGRLLMSGDEESAEPDASRILACQLCGALSLVDPDMIRQQYENSQVKAVPGGTLFTCPSCGELGAHVEVLNFDVAVVRCEQCGETLLEQEGDAKKAIRADEVKTDDQGKLAFHCPKCDAFSGHMVPKTAPTEE